MLFNSGIFLLFFPIVVLGYFLLPKKAKNFWLLVSSYYFYMSWNAVYGLLLFGCTAGGKKSRAEKNRRHRPRRGQYGLRPGSLREIDGKKAFYPLVGHRFRGTGVF